MSVNPPMRPNYYSRAPYPHEPYTVHDNSRRENFGGSSVHQDFETPGSGSEPQTPQHEISEEDNIEVVEKNNMKGMGKGEKRLKWSPIQDTDLCFAWLTTSNYGVKGTDQSFNNYWENIVAYYNQYKKEGPVMTLNQASNHWKFGYLHSWKILKEQPKWQQFAKKEDRSSKRTKNSVSGTYTSSSSNPDASENDNVVEVMDVRPPGQKAAKAAARGKGNAKNKKTNPEAMETWSKFEELQAKKMSLYEERIRVQDFELLCKDTSNLDENARKNHESVCQYIRTKYGI
ncbi:uncharacterized protein LOC104898817 [Beta vulgaris subsp. vulgaris]|uniref:uncharacterized protein LOC104898817 n=1 Tax=Beta vulgaris subsp. vulgaris TaxID=3555 RepID=UPI00053FF8AA|nr:uncharacterized protein LOC104898817 [Beta vulgaris subsp. vulgaris]